MLSILKTIRTIRRNVISDAPVPLSVLANITGLCNLRCEFCEKGQAPTTGESGELSLEAVKELVDLAERFDCALFFSGGEPFLHRQIWDILAYCHSLGRRVNIATNATCFEGLTGEQFELLGLTIGVMSVSIDSATPARHDSIRGKAGSFARALRFIQNPARTCRVAISSVLKSDLAEAQGLIALADKLRCPLNFQPIQFGSNYPHTPALASKEKIRLAMNSNPAMDRQLHELHRRARKCSVATNLGLVRQFFSTYCSLANSQKFFGDRVLSRFLCVAPLLQVTVDETGLLCPCALLPGQAKAAAGDLYENWRAQALDYRRAWLAGRRQDICRSCTCHFAENFRSSILAYPWANRQKIPWLVAYYAGRLYHKAGRKI